MLLWIAGLFLVSAAVALVAGRRDAARGARVRRTPTSSIAALGAAHVEVAGPVEIVGRVLQGPEGTFESPIRGRPSVWCRVVHEVRGSSSWGPKSVAIHSLPFLVEDASGGVARVEATGAVVPGLMKHVGVARDVPDAADRFFGDHRVASAEPTDTRFLKDETGRQIGFEAAQVGDSRCVEDALHPGDPIYALGLVRRPVPSAAPYRAGAAPLIELHRGTSASDELLLSSEDERSLRIRLGMTRFFGYAFLCIGAIFVACHFLMRAFSS